MPASLINLKVSIPAEVEAEIDRLKRVADSSNTEWPLVDTSGNVPTNSKTWGGTALTGRDITGDLAKLQYLVNLDNMAARLDTMVAQLTTILDNTESIRVTVLPLDHIDADLSTRATETTLASLLAQTDVALSTRASQATVASILAQLDVALSTRASQATVNSILEQLDVDLSTRASETTLASILALLPTSLTSAGNLKSAVMEIYRKLHDSTTTPLGSGASWTSTAEDALGYGRVTVSCFADQNGTLYVEQSPDNTNWDVSSAFNYALNTTQGYSVEIVSRYARVRFVNGASAQATFRLYAYLRSMP